MKRLVLGFGSRGRQATRRACLALAVAIAAVGQARAAIVPIPLSSFSGSETVITFSNATDNKSGDPITLGGVTFDNLSTGSLYSGYAFGFNRGIWFGNPTDDGQLMDLSSKSDFTITFPSPVNRVGMALASGYNPATGNTATWLFDIYGTANNLLGTTSVDGAVFDIGNGGTFGSLVSFIGFQSSDSIAKVRVYQTESDGYTTMMDNLRFEAVAPQAAVPEPASLALWALGGIGLIGGAIRRRRKPRAA